MKFRFFHFCTVQFFRVCSKPVEIVTSHLFDDKHTMGHRMLVGLLVMVVGVIVAKSGHIVSHNTLIIYGADVMGYGIHGVGASPYIEHLFNGFKNNDKGK